MIYVADSQSDSTVIRGLCKAFGSAALRTAKSPFIPMPSAEVGAPEGVGVDDTGNVYGGWVAKMAVRRFVKQ